MQGKQKRLCGLIMKPNCVGVFVLESMQIRRSDGNGRAAFLDFYTLRPVFNKVRFQDPCGRSAKMVQYT